jgi:type 1 glutamine amidotransferase
MKRKLEFNPPKWLLLILFVSASNILFTSKCLAQTKERVLIYTGGHEFEREAFFDMFKDIPDLDYQDLIHPQTSPVFDSALIAQFDVLLFYDMVQEIDAAQKAALIKILEEGKGVVFLHHSLVSYQEWDEFEKIIGGRYGLTNIDQDSSTYRHDVDIPVTIVDKDHPITKGMDDFVIRDEVYGNFKVLPTVHPLLKTTHPESGEIIGWTNSYGKSRIVYLQLGHDHFAFENPAYRHIVKQAIEWVQKDDSPLVRYAPGFEFKDGLYLNIEEVRNNDPIPLARIVTDLGSYNKDFINEMHTSEKIILHDDYGIRKFIYTKDLWGYAESGRLYIMAGGQFQRIIIQGSISLFTASATTHEKTKLSQRDTSLNYTTTEDLYRSHNRKYYYANVTGESKEYLFDFQSNTLAAYTVEVLEKLLLRDFELFSEYTSLRKRDKKDRMAEFIRRYNQNHPLYFPVN